MLSKPYARTDWHPVQTLRPVSWAFPRPGTRERFAEISHVRTDAGWVFVAVTVAGERLGPFHTLEDAAMECHKRGLAGLVRPELNETPPSHD